MDKDWLQLTNEDIERARRLASQTPSIPDAVVITPDDINDRVDQVRNQEGILTITLDDLEPSLPRHDTTSRLGDLEQQMYELVNDARKQHLPGWLGTAKLLWHNGLAAISRGHADDMLRRQYIAHESPEGITTARRIDMQGIRYVACGENIGVVYGNSAGTSSSVQDIHNAFMNQPRSLTNHRGNLLNPIWTHIGIGIAYNSEGSLVATQTFISAPASRVRGR